MGPPLPQYLWYTILISSKMTGLVAMTPQLSLVVRSALPDIKGAENLIDRVRNTDCGVEQAPLFDEVLLRIEAGKRVMIKGEEALQVHCREDRRVSSPDGILFIPSVRALI